MPLAIAYLAWFVGCGAIGWAIGDNREEQIMFTGISLIAGYVILVTLETLRNDG